ncbi:MAG TPA: sigma factor [Candidatus Limnocylindrales bacterium]|nr:sigma factor [Candidatus Limnocylindrales bacterium]
MGLSTAIVGEEFDGFYTAYFRDTVAMTYTLTADMVEAQDIAQEAFCRAWRRRQDIRGYDKLRGVGPPGRGEPRRSRQPRMRTDSSTIVFDRIGVEWLAVEVG